MARVVLTRSARRVLITLDYILAEAVLNSIGVLEREPQVGHALRGRLQGLCSLRVGVYRIIYELRDEDATVRVIAIRHRTEAYQTDPR